MVANKWIAGAGTRALDLTLLEDVCCEQNDKSHASESAVEEKTLVCVSDEVLQHPEKLLLSDAQFCSFPFVCTESVSYNARISFRSECVTQALVHSANDMLALNLAASLKLDFPSKRVVLVADNNDKDFLHRAALALVDAIIPVNRFYQSLLLQHIQAPQDLQGNEKALQASLYHQDQQAIQNQHAPQGVQVMQDQYTPQDLQDDIFSLGVPTLNFDMSEIEEPPVVLLHEGDFGVAVQDSVQVQDNIQVQNNAPVQNTKTSREDLRVEPNIDPNIDLRLDPGVTPNVELSIQPNIGPNERNANARAFFLPVISASGGTGKSTIAYLAALSSVQLGCKTLLIDLDLQFGDEVLYSQIEQATSITQLAQAPCEIAQLQPTPEGFYFVSSCDTPEQSEDVQANLQQILHTAFATFDVVIANGPTTWNDSHIELLEQAGKIFFVLDQRLSSVHSAQKAFDLCMRCGLAASPFLFLLNKCTKQSALTYLDVTCATQGTPCKELPDGGRLVSEYLEARQASCLFEEKNNLARVLFDIVADTLPGCNVLNNTRQSRRAPRFLRGKKRRRERE